MITTMYKNKLKTSTFSFINQNKPPYLQKLSPRNRGKIGSMASHPPPDQEAADPNTPFDASASDDASPAPMADADPSPAGIFFKFPSASGYIFNCFANPPQESFLRVPQPFTICSSSKGLLLCHDSNNNEYRLVHPFISEPHNFKSIPAPRSHKDCHTAVLSVEEVPPASFDIICAVEDANGKYAFDWYHSRADKWSPCTAREDHISPRRIKNDTGISNDSGTALWLIEDLTAVVAFDVNLDLSRRFDLPTDVQHPRRAQLGKINENEIGIVVLHGGGDGSMIAVYTLDYDSGSWRKYRSLDLITAGFMERTIQPVGSPLLIRFDKVVVIFVGSRSILWEMSSGNDQMNCEDTRLRELDHWQQRPQPEDETVPCVFFNITPEQFPLINADEEIAAAEEDGEESNGEQGDVPQENGRDPKRRRI